MSTKPDKLGEPWPEREAIVEAICARLEKGEALEVICREEGMPASRTVRDWRTQDPAIGERFDEARDIGFDAIARDCLEIADDGRRDYQVLEDGREVVDHDHISRARLRVETRLKLLAKWDPRRYGDKIEHSGPGGTPLPAPQFIIQPVMPKADGDA